jgi:hypothetical protein
MTDDERRDIAQRAFEEYSRMLELRPDPARDESLINSMLRLMHLNPAYETMDAIAWVLRILYYRFASSTLGTKVALNVVILPLPQAIIDEIADDIQKPPPGLSYPQLIEDIKQTYRPN